MTKPEDVIVMMNRMFAALGTGIHGRRRAYKLLLCYFGTNISHRAIRYDLKCRDAMVTEIRGTVYRTLDGSMTVPIAEMTDELEKHTLIRSADNNTHSFQLSKLDVPQQNQNKHN